MKTKPVRDLLVKSSYFSFKWVSWISPSIREKQSEQLGTQKGSSELWQDNAKLFYCKET